MKAAPRPPEVAVDTVTWLPEAWATRLQPVFEGLSEDARRQRIEEARSRMFVGGGVKR